MQSLAICSCVVAQLLFLLQFLSSSRFLLFLLFERRKKRAEGTIFSLSRIFFFVFFLQLFCWTIEYIVCARLLCGFQTPSYYITFPLKHLHDERWRHSMCRLRLVALSPSDCVRPVVVLSWAARGADDHQPNHIRRTLKGTKLRLVL